MLTSSFVIAKHSVAVLHRENFVIDSSVVSVLISEVVKLLAELSNKLVFLRASDLDSSLLLWNSVKCAHNATYSSLGHIC